jgi:hypothetical protein
VPGPEHMLAIGPPLLAMSIRPRTLCRPGGVITVLLGTSYPRPVKRMAGFIIFAGMALLAAACGGSPSSTSSSGSSPGGGSANTHLLPFARCMRSHRVPNFPDPASDNKFPGAQHLGVSDPLYQAAMNACKHLLPNGGTGPSGTDLQQQRSALLPFARCMRSNGVANWPDPSIHTNATGAKAVVFDLVGIQGLDYKGITSPKVQSSVRQCQHFLPEQSPGTPPFRIMRN